MNCKRVREELIFLYDDNEMGQETLIAFQQHMVDCPECAQEVQYTRRLLTIVRQRATRCCAPSDLRQRLVERLRES